MVLKELHSSQSLLQFSATLVLLFQVVAVQGLRKEFKTNEGAKSKSRPCLRSSVEEGGEKEEKVKVAVRNLSLGVEEGEVLGLLGHNGAGKTTTMRIIIAEEAPTCGSVRIGPYNVDSNMSKGFELLGYCPQVRLGTNVSLVLILKLSLALFLKYQLSGTYYF